MSNDKFNWHKTLNGVEHGSHCNLIMRAEANGYWQVCWKDGRVFADAITQTPGRDLEDAKRRAQSAAMACVSGIPQEA